MLQHLIENENAALAVSPDGHTLATAIASELVLWDTTMWKPRQRIATGLNGNVLPYKWNGAEFTRHYALWFGSLQDERLRSEEMNGLAGQPGVP